MEKEKEKQNGNVKSNRRGFIGRFAKLAAAAGIGGVILAQLKEKGGIPPAYAAPGAAVLIDAIPPGAPPIGGNVGAATTWLDSGTAAGGAPGTFVARNTAVGPFGEGLIGITENLALPLPIPAGVYGLANTGVGVRGDSATGQGVYGYASSTNAGNATGVYGQSDSTFEGTGVEGYAKAGSGDTVGVYGHSESTSGRGVQGIAASYSGTTYGVYGESESIQGYGMYGNATNQNGITYGVYGSSISTQGYGMYGIAGNASGPTLGVYGESDSIDGTGVQGYAQNPSGTTHGVVGVSDSIQGTGVQGYASNQSGATCGVYGESHSIQGTGVLGAAGNPGAVPVAAQAYGGGSQTASLQEWRKSDGTPLSVVDKDGNFGIGTASPVRQVHISGNNATVRIDRNVDSAQFLLVRTSADFSQVWKTFIFGVKATGVDAGKFFIGDMHTNVSGSSDNRILIDTSGNVGIGTTTPSSKLHVNGRVKALGYDTGDITYANGMKTTEEGTGLAFLNDAGEKIAVLDRQGNWHIKGDIIKDL